MKINKLFTVGCFAVLLAAAILLTSADAGTVSIYVENDTDSPFVMMSMGASGDEDFTEDLIDKGGDALEPGKTMEFSVNAALNGESVDIWVMGDGDKDYAIYDFTLEAGMTITITEDDIEEYDY